MAVSGKTAKDEVNADSYLECWSSAGSGSDAADWMTSPLEKLSELIYRDAN